MTDVILWVYIVLLMVGGVLGLIKGRSKVSLIMSSAFALLLALCNIRVITPFYIAYILIGLLLIVFAMRLAKTKKFMPSGLMLLVSCLTLIALLAAK